MTNWQEGKLGDVCDVRDGTHDTPKEASEGKYLVTSKHIKSGKIDLSSAYKISLEDFNFVNQRSKVDQWDILISMIGTVGEICLVSEHPDFAIKNVGLIKTGNEYLAKYLYYYLKSPVAQNDILSRLRGTTQQYLPLGEIRDFPVYLPPLEMQKKIAGVLGALDDKIELNNKINQNLEAQAQALFKSWFVDKEYEIEKNVTLGAVCKCELGGTPSRKKSEYWNGNIAWINSGEVNNFRIIKASEYITAAGLEHSATKLLPKKTTVLAITGATLGQISLLEIDSCTNQSVVGILENEILPYEFIYPYVCYNIKELLSHQTGGAQQHINKQNVEHLALALPKSTVVNEYKNIVSPVFELIAKNCFENECLISLRDTLLPKLMFGEIDVSRVNISIDKLSFTGDK